jgi:hypothetical protein
MDWGCQNSFFSKENYFSKDPLIIVMGIDNKLPMKKYARTQGFQIGM